VNFFVNKINRVPCCRRRNRLPSGQTSSLDLNRVSPVNNGSYAVSSKPGVCLEKWPDSPPAGWKIPFLFTTILHFVQNCCEQDKQSTMLPQAKQTSIGSNVQFGSQPRKSCE
jgi:hypothetical protein